MHAVILKVKPGMPPGHFPINPYNYATVTHDGQRKELYICCHVRKVDPNEGQSLEDAN